MRPSKGGVLDPPRLPSFSNSSPYQYRPIYYRDMSGYKPAWRENMRCVPQLHCCRCVRVYFHWLTFAAGPCTTVTTTSGHKSNSVTIRDFFKTSLTYMRCNPFGCIFGPPPARMVLHCHHQWSSSITFDQNGRGGSRSGRGCHPVRWDTPFFDDIEIHTSTYVPIANSSTWTRCSLIFSANWQLLWQQSCIALPLWNFLGVLG